ncbi:MAG TPA: YjbF family lipoprotein, partial [Xanthomonadaceae bacterium]|nr:YjbF family lipoprotein [Xanthomonadaceae bacterium]
RWPSGNPFVPGLQGLGSGFEGIRIVDWSPGYRYGVAEHVRLVPAGMEDVNILGTIHHLRRVDEHVDSPEAGFTAENHYWIDPADGFIWKSHQVVAPGMPLDLVQLRPYRDGTP